MTSQVGRASAEGGQRPIGQVVWREERSHPMIKTEYVLAMQHAKAVAEDAIETARLETNRALEAARTLKAAPDAPYARELATDLGRQAADARREARDAKEARASARRVVLGTIALQARQAEEAVALDRALAVRPLKPPPRRVNDDD